MKGLGKWKENILTLMQEPREDRFVHSVSITGAQDILHAVAEIEDCIDGIKLAYRSLINDKVPTLENAIMRIIDSKFTNVYTVDYIYSQLFGDASRDDIDYVLSLLCRMHKIHSRWVVSGEGIETKAYGRVFPREALTR